MACGTVWPASDGGYHKCILEAHARGEHKCDCGAKTELFHPARPVDGPAAVTPEADQSAEALLDALTLERQGLDCSGCASMPWDMRSPEFQAARAAVLARMRPRVDVRKVCDDHPELNGLDWADIANAMRAAGIEVIE